MNRVFRRVLPLVAGGMLLAATAAFALQSGDIIKQGVEAYRAGNYKRALDLFTQAQRLDPGGPKPHYFIGSALEKLEEPDSARVEYETAIRIDPKYVEALTGLGNLLRRQGKTEEGTAKLQEAVKYSPKDPPALYALGQAYLKDKKWDDAYNVFTKGTLLKQGRALFLDGQALALEGKGEYKKAEEILIRARETDPNNLRVRLDLGGFYERKKIPVLAAPEYVKAAELDPKNPEPHFLAGRAYVGMNAFNDGLKEFMNAIAADSSYAPPYLEAGRLYFRAKRYPDAAEKLQAYTGLKPDDPEGYVELGRALALSQNPDDRQKAIPVLEKAYEQNPQSCEVAGALGKLYFERRPQPDLENALKYYDRYAKCADTLMTAEDHLRLGTMYVANKDSAKAVPQLARASQMDSTLAKDANFQLGFLYFARKDFAGAIPYFEAALRADSAFMPALLNIGLAKLAVKQPNEGISYLRRALEVNPKETRARVWIAQTLTALDSLPEALEMYQSAIADTANPNAEAYRGAGVVLLLQKNWGEAIPYLEHGVQLEPDNIQGHIWLAQAYSNAGDVNRAKAEFNRAIDINPNNPDAARGLALIRKYEEQKAAKQSGAAKPSEAPKKGESAIKTGAAKKSGTP